MPSTDAPTTIAEPHRGARHVWFPIVVIAAAVAWWVRQATETDYATFYHVLVVLATAAAVSIWFARWGPGTTRTRNRLVWGVWLALFAWLALFKPVYNGDMGIWSWRLRWAAQSGSSRGSARRSWEAGTASPSKPSRDIFRLRRSLFSSWRGLA